MGPLRWDRVSAGRWPSATVLLRTAFVPSPRRRGRAAVSGIGVCSNCWLVRRGCQNGDERRCMVASRCVAGVKRWAKGSIAFVARGSLSDVTAPSLTGLQAAHQSTLELVSARIELVSDRGWEGGFKWSSQCSIERGCDGQAEGVGVGVDGPAGDGFAGGARRSAGGSIVSGSGRRSRVG
jgi:hypothetical protein